VVQQWIRRRALAPSQAHVVRRLLRVAWEQRARCLAVLGIQLLLLGLTVIAFGWSGLAVDLIHHALSPGGPALHFPWGLRPPVQLTASAQVLLLAAAIVLVGLARTGLGYLYAVAVADLVQVRIVPTIRAQVYDKLQHLSFRFFDRQSSGSLLNRITSDVQLLRSFVDGVLIQSIVLLLATAVYGGYMLSRHVGLTLVCLATTPIMCWVTLRFSRRVLPAHAHSRAQADELVRAVAEAVQGIQVVKGFAAEDSVLAELARKNAAVRDGQRRIFQHVSRYTPSVDLLIHANTLSLLLYGGTLVVRGRLSVGDLVAFGALLQQFSTHVTNLSTIVNTLQESLIGARRVFEVLDAETEIVSPPQPCPLARVTGQVRFENVTFGYAPGRAAVSGIDFSVQPGQCIALFGAAGAGKSTLLSLIPRFYDPDQGRVLLDGVDVRELDLNTLRRAVAVVFQETFLFSHSVAANIAFGHPEASRAQIERAARIACAHDFIEALPAGYDTLLGERASNLSGGQRQRLAIARALLTDPPILLLDDPTAALDAHTTREILTSLKAAGAGRTTFLVTHRPLLLKQADRVLVLAHGRVLQQGTPFELSQLPGPYRDALRLHAHDEPPRLPAARTARQDTTL
jgi:ABC-type multidrug transport system fused ATPase/permease subunit